ncbi:Protein of uncharacterised function (DUF459) [Cardiobacterium valvarum]|uniref:Protein of uncharacterized function (DUF459) n=1 Tax=Cardiobacterium valvarum TaxID=194702 RepID=A0A381EAR7_9GAMM|nr:SGNH family hydrolase [Cardiobacterium valvarum]SUX24040.1 Protein of uncharacterised function (DUF459) [Cardiobacterium valvarum]
MPTRILKILATLSTTFILALWLMQHGIEQYWQQTYYRASPLAGLQHFAVWRSGDRLKHTLYTLLGAGNSVPHEPVTIPKTVAAPKPQPAPAVAAEPAAKNPAPAAPITPPEPVLPAPEDNHRALWAAATLIELPAITTDIYTSQYDPLILARLRPLAEESVAEDDDTQALMADSAETPAEQEDDGDWRHHLATELAHTHPIYARTYLANNDGGHTSIINSTPIHTFDTPVTNPAPGLLDLVIPGATAAPTLPLVWQDGDDDSNDDTDPPAADDDNQTAAQTAAPSGPIQLGADDRVLLIGDSMMKSLAPHIQRELLSRYHIKSMNHGKPSSGLRYPDYYNWPENLATLLDENPDVRLIVVMLGANDPQNTPNPAAPAENLHFGTPEWETYYRGEIRKILTTAAAHNVKTLWIGPPLMKSPKYSNKISYLDGLIADEVEKANQHYQNTNRLFAQADGSYTTYLPDERGKPVAVRKSDGIHFTTQGEKILTQHVLARINP